VDGGARAVQVLRDGAMYGGDTFFYYIGTGEPSVLKSRRFDLICLKTVAANRDIIMK